MSMRMILPTIAPAIISDLNLTDSDAYTLVGVFNMSTGVSLYLFGFLSGKIGWKKVVLVGIAGSVVFSVIFSSLNVYVLLILLASAAGIFLGGYLPSGTALLTNSYKRENRGFIVGVHETGAASGQLIGPLLVGVSIVFVSWRFLFGGWALFGILPFILYFVVAPNNISVRRPLTKTHSNWTIAQNFRIVAIYVGMFACALGFVSAIPVYMVSVFKLPLPLVATILAVARIPAPIGQMLSGKLSDKYGRRPALLIIICSVIITTALIAYSSFGVVFVIAIFGQFFATACFYPVILSEISDSTVDYDRSGKMGLANSAGTIIGSGVVPIMIGFIAQSYSYTFAFLFPLLLGLGSLLVAVLIRPKLLNHTD